DLPLLWPCEANVHVTPARRSRQGFDLFRCGLVGHVGKVHAAEICHTVVNDEELAMVAAVQGAEERENTQSGPRRGGRGRLYAGPLDAREKCAWRCAAAYSVIKNTNLQSGLGSFAKCRGDSLASGIIEEDVGFQPNALPRRTNVGNHGLDQRRRLNEDV